MHKVLLAAAACFLAMSAQAVRADIRPYDGTVLTPQNSPTAAVTEFIAALNTGDLDKAAGLVAPSAAIVDPNSAMFTYHSFADWRRDFSRTFNGSAFTDYRLIAGEYLSMGSTSDGRSDCVMPAVVTFRIEGKEFHRRGIMEFVEARTKDGWRITGWAWSSLELQPFWDSLHEPVFRQFDLPGSHGP